MKPRFRMLEEEIRIPVRAAVERRPPGRKTLDPRLPLLARLAGMVLCLSAPGWLSAQPVGGPTSTALPAGQEADRLNRPGLPGQETPIDYFRRLLAQTPEARERSLAGAADSYKTFLRSKFDEYDALPPEERAWRLRLAQLHYHMSQFIKLPASNRTERLKLLRPDERKDVEQRLAQWDSLSDAERREFLEHEQVLNSLFKNGLPTPPGQKSRIETTVAHWRALPPERRRQMMEHFEQFFELPEKERKKTLSTFSESERREMEKTLQLFAKLPPARRQRSIASFAKFTAMTESEREHFLVNAERWRGMSPNERQTWRGLVTKLPPLPPGFPPPVTAPPAGPGEAPPVPAVEMLVPRPQQP